MAIYKTPGVKVEEVSILPPSVAQVETAVPAFIGYTEKADRRLPGDLLMKPTKVESLLEYRQLFGGAPPLNITGVNLAGDASLRSATVQPEFLMYYSLQLFFDHGGGQCYIVSVGDYSSQVKLGDPSDPTNPASHGLDVGLSELAKWDEPTIIVFPDAILLPDSDELYQLQLSALEQCNELQDRFAIFDLLESKPSDPGFDWTSGRDEFRNRIGTSYLKYGAAYAPHLRTRLIDRVEYRDFRNNAQFGSRFSLLGAPIGLAALPGADAVSDAVSRLESTADDLDLIENEFRGTQTSLANASPEDTLRNRAADDYGVPTTDADDVAQILEILHASAAASGTLEDFMLYVDFLYEIVVFADGWIFDDTSTHHADVDYRDEAEASLFARFKAEVVKLVAFDKGAVSGLGDLDTPRFRETGGGAANIEDRVTDGDNYAPEINFASATAGPPADTDPFNTGATDAAKRRHSLRRLKQISEQLFLAVNNLVDLAANRYASAERNVSEALPAYNNLVRALRRELSTLPPSGAIAGIYARVDANRGVWKAPANESLGPQVTDLTVRFTKSDTDGLNVDDFGKSINAIQFFTGRGHMVWGARTLDGNSNEWRYISVRRFFNMVEESVKKSTAWAVFEPNDAGTWLKVRGMIEAFLTLQWRDGALQGAKPGDAFFVKVGLGQTMTSLDVLEGRMIVEIGMAVVRPAEFIILKFQHKMVETG